MDLTLALAALAAVVLLALAGWGTWQARRLRLRQPDATDAPSAGPAGGRAPLAVVGDDDAGSAPGHWGDERREPTLDGLPGTAAPGDADPQAVDLDLSADIPTPAPAAVVAPAPRRHEPRVDALIDAVIILTPDAPVYAEHLWPHLPTTRRAGSKPFVIEALNAETGDWESPRLGQRYTELQAGLQLANRQGATSEIEYSEFVQKLEPVSDAIGAAMDAPDMLDVVARARELDTFASQADAVLTVHLRARSVAWSLGFVQQCAQRRGFVAGNVAGRMVRPGAAEGDPPVLVLAMDAQAALADDPGQAALRMVSLSLDVPQTPEAQEPFVQWQDMARDLAGDLDATPCDDAGQPVTLQAYGAIEQELARIYGLLAARDLAAGSAAARRLFS